VCRRGWRTRSTYGDSADGLEVREWSEFKKRGRLPAKRLPCALMRAVWLRRRCPNATIVAFGRTLALLAMNGNGPRAD
jgi:hypothetical protein